MPNALSPIPVIADEDVEWVSALMGLNAIDAPRRAFLTSRSTLDVSACPGSGKTTLIVAKLAILARNWPHRTKGICVLSHTNVAREEIQHRLGGTVVGQRLLGYTRDLGINCGRGRGGTCGDACRAARAGAVRDFTRKENLL